MKIVESLKHARKHLTLAKVLLEKRRTVADKRLTTIESLPVDDDEKREERLDAITHRAEEIVGAIDDRLGKLDDLIATIEGEIDEINAEATERTKKRQPKTLKYMIRKRNRPTDTAPYYGNSCARGGVKPGLYYDTKEAAQIDCDKLNAVNSKGFDVVEVMA